MQENIPEYYNSNFIKKDAIYFRKYQVNILKDIKKKNSLVVLPTGLGKTIIAIFLIAETLKKYSEGKILILAPTRPLVAQHVRSCKKYLTIDENKIVSLTGKIKPEKRIYLFWESKIIVSTPQVIKNDILRGRYDLSQTSLIIVDEAHRCRGNYAYTDISKEYLKSCSDPLILGLTASPGKDQDWIQEICDNLFTEKVIFRSRESPDVEQYLNDIDIHLEYTDLPLEYIELSTIWDSLFRQFLKFFIQRGLINPHKKYYSKIDFLRLAEDLTISLRFEDLLDENIKTEIIGDNLYYNSPRIIDIVRERNLSIHSIYSYCSTCISLLHGKDLLETQDLSLFKAFLEKIVIKAEHDNLSAKRIQTSEHFKLISSMIDKDSYSILHHPKVALVISILQEELTKYKNKKVIVFTQFRQMATVLKQQLKSRLPPEIRIEKFIGQTSKMDDRGYSQLEQGEIMEKFREGEINILIATSVAEEGLDIPNVDAIVFYEPIPSEIRFIQRRGRTGRHSPGRCYILITNNTVDVPFYKVACEKENAMKSILSNEVSLDLKESISRKAIDFSKKPEAKTEWEIIQEFNERREKERELLANRSVEEIIEEMDKFSNSKEFRKFKNFGVTFFSDVVDISKSKLKNGIINGKVKKKMNKKKPIRKPYLNKNLKTLINLTETYSNEGSIDLMSLKEVAEKEDINEKKFFIHLNQACYLGYLERGPNDLISIIKELE